MKKVLTVALASFVTLLSFAADRPGDGRLRISNLCRQDILIVVDGRVFNDRNDHLMVGGLRPGYHTVKVYRQERGHRNRGGIFRNGGRNQHIYNSTVYVSPRSETRMIVDRGGQVFVERSRDRNYGYGDGRRDRDYGRDRDYDYGRGGRDRDWRK